MTADDDRSGKGVKTGERACALAPPQSWSFFHARDAKKPSTQPFQRLVVAGKLEVSGTENQAFGRKHPAGTFPVGDAVQPPVQLLIGMERLDQEYALQTGFGISRGQSDTLG